MTDYDTDTKEISGPVNIVRLQGVINGTKKVIYLFMDFHEPLQWQTECTNIFSKDVNKFFAEIFYKLQKGSKTYDFFLEIRPTEELVDAKNFEQKEKSKMIYLAQVMKLFTKVFKYDKDTKKVSVPDIFKNVRLHYLDVRDYFYENIFHRLQYVLNIAHSFVHTNRVYNPNLEEIIGILNFVRQHLVIVVDALTMKSYQEPKEKPILLKKQQDPHATDIEMVKKLADKIKNKYNNDEVKKILNDYINNLVDRIENLIKYISNGTQLFNRFINNLSSIGNKLIWDEFYKGYVYGISPQTMRKIIDAVIEICESIHHDALDIFARLTDIYFMRRFLDKRYITNGIVYAGAFHIINYINMLVKDFGFEITHASYSKINNIKELNDEVKKLKDTEIEILFFRPELYQCSDLKNFPDDFE